MANTDLELLDTADEDTFGLAVGEEAIDLDAEDEFEPVRLTRSQWLKIGLTIFVSFIFFMVLFFPIEELITYIVYNTDKGVDFQSIELNFFSKDRIKNLRINKGAMLDLTARQVDSGLGWFGLGRRYWNGPVIIKQVELHNPAFGARIAKIEADLNLGPIDLGGKSRGFPEGSARLAVDKMSFDHIAPLSIGKDVLKISRARLHLVIENKRLNIREFDVSSNAFRIRMQQARVGLTDRLATSELRGKLCLTPTSEFLNDEKFDTLRTLYRFSGAPESGEYCMDLQGTLGKPSVKTKPPVILQSEESISDDSEESSADTLKKQNIPETKIESDLKPNN